MLPVDTDWFANDGNEPITHDFCNAIERSVDFIKSPTSDGTFPPPTGTTLPWGGGKIFFFMDDDGLADDASVMVDNTIDWRKRMIYILDAHLYDAANKLPGGGAEPPDQRSFQYYGHAGYTNIGSADGEPPAANHIDITDSVFAVVGFFYVNAAAPYELMYRSNVAWASYPMFTILASDQFPTR